MTDSGGELTVAILDARPRGYPADCVKALLLSGNFSGAELIGLDGRNGAGNRLSERPEGRVAQTVPDTVSSALERPEVRRAFAALECVARAPGTDAAEAKNLAMARANGRYVLLLFSDVFVTPGCVETLREFLDAHPRTAAAGALLLRENGWLRPSRYDTPGLWPQLGRPLRFLTQINPRSRRYQQTRLEIAPQEKVAALPSACVMVRREAWLEIGEFTPGYDFDVDAVEWGIRAKKKRWRIHLVPPARAFHVPPQENLPLPVAGRLAYERSLLRCIERTRGRAYARVFRLLRAWRAVRLMLLTGAGWVLTGRRSALCRDLAAGYARLAGWHLGGRPEQGDPAPAAEVAEAVSTRRWETELL